MGSKIKICGLDHSGSEPFSYFVTASINHRFIGELHLLEHIHRVIVPPSGKKMELEEPTNVFSINQAQLQCNT